MNIKSLDLYCYGFKRKNFAFIHTTPRGTNHRQREALEYLTAMNIQTFLLPKTKQQFKKLFSLAP
jgi:hypothetical protein